jgi:hypothetical protein
MDRDREVMDPVAQTQGEVVADTADMVSQLVITDMVAMVAMEVAANPQPIMCMDTTILGWRHIIRHPEGEGEDGDNLHAAYFY